VQRIDPLHGREVGSRGWPGQIIDAAAADPNSDTFHLTGNACERVDQRFALGNRPALPSAPDKKSFTNVSLPVLACNVFTSIAGYADSLWPSDPKTAAAPSSNWPRQIVIWFG